MFWDENKSCSSLETHAVPPPTALTTSSHVSFCCCYFDITRKPFENIIRFLLRCSHRTHKIYLCFFQLNFITISLLFACISLLTSLLLLPSFRMLNIFWIHKPCFHCAAIISSLAAALGWKQKQKKRKRFMSSQTSVFYCSTGWECGWQSNTQFTGI